MKSLMIRRSEEEAGGRHPNIELGIQMGQDSLICFRGECQAVETARSPRADESEGIYQALNRGNGRTAISNKEADYDALRKLKA